jgi:hypothetical protein
MSWIESESESDGRSHSIGGVTYDNTCDVIIIHDIMS